MAEALPEVNFGVQHKEWSLKEQAAEAMAKKFIDDGDVADAVEFLRANSDMTVPFCMAVQECYKPTDTTSVILRLAEVIEGLAAK